MVWNSKGPCPSNWLYLRSFAERVCIEWRKFNLQKRVDLYNTKLHSQIIYVASTIISVVEGVMKEEVWRKIFFHNRYISALKRPRKQMGEDCLYCQIFYKRYILSYLLILLKGISV
uniref:Uncharacterized protein n=1 Tax=Lepeophtheirus salmonis TaxID=72036 RepID=A0A0K2UDP5_LEPSM